MSLFHRRGKQKHCYHLIAVYHTGIGKLSNGRRQAVEIRRKFCQGEKDVELIASRMSSI